MAEYIDREKACQELLRAFSFHSYAGSMAVSTINDIPAADVVERKRGKWRYMDADFAFAWLCSECGAEALSSHSMFVEPSDNFCPNCGADMRGKADG